MNFMDEYIKLAKKTIEEYVIYGKVMDVPRGLPEELYFRKSGVFVTILKNGDLLGCIGTVLPVRKNIAQEIIDNAVAACSRDYRFSPVKKSDLKEMKCEVSVLSKPQLIKDFKLHNPKEHGLIVRSSDGRTGLLLPGLEGINTIEEQFSICCQKGGIDPSSDEIVLCFFTTERHI